MRRSSPLSSVVPVLFPTGYNDVRVLRRRPAVRGNRRCAGLLNVGEATWDDGTLLRHGGKLPRVSAILVFVMG
ncbi:hypothetical protein ERO13_D02G146050v2 [Gossypium hirsutum]|nr:hypothetical protein ERO13_D02G146050v2 [Gossypium hirsutum]